MPNVELQPFHTEGHFPLIETWLNRPHVARWWGEPNQNLLELRQRRRDAEAIIVMNGIPVGYLCWQKPSQSELEEAGLTELPSDLIDMDIMIGELGALGQGVGPEALRQLFERLRAQGVSVVGVAAAAANQRALNAYAKVGLQPFQDFFERGELYRYFTKKLIDTAQQGAPDCTAMRCS
jgi:aminoglycoside 6'-N-acetyltransferase